MFARVFALLPLALLVSATHLEARDQCSTSNQNCCNSVQTVNPSCISGFWIAIDVFPVAITVGTGKQPPFFLWPG
jgi:hypothetical protein